MADAPDLSSYGTPVEDLPDLSHLGTLVDTPKREKLLEQMSEARDEGTGAEWISKGIDAASRLAEQATPAGLMNIPMRLTGQPDVFEAGKPFVPIPKPAGTDWMSGAGRVAAGALESLETPEGFVTLPAFGASKLVRGLTAAQMLMSVPEGAKKGVEILLDDNASAADKLEAMGNPVWPPSPRHYCPVMARPNPPACCRHRALKKLMTCGKK